MTGLFMYRMYGISDGRDVKERSVCNILTNIGGNIHHERVALCRFVTLTQLAHAVLALLLNLLVSFP